MLFASDLDQTLIYSKKHFTQPNLNVSLVERIEDREISFMTKTAIYELEKLSKEIYFTPVTTRTIDQYKRITVFQKEIIPRHAVVSNGGNVLENGQIDKEWQKNIKNKIDNDCISFYELLLKFNTINSDKWVINQYTADNLFHYFIVDENNVPLEELKHLKVQLEKDNWNTFLHGRKLYFIPLCINKWDAVEYIKNKMNIDYVVASGDSLLDLCMLENADYAIYPSHGKLNEEIKGIKSIEKTENIGILAGEEIIKKVGLLLKSASY